MKNALPHWRKLETLSERHDRMVAQDSLLSFYRLFLFIVLSQETVSLHFLNFIFLARPLFAVLPAGNDALNEYWWYWWIPGQDDRRLYFAVVGFLRVPPLLLICSQCLLVVSWLSNIGEPSYFLQSSRKGRNRSYFPSSAASSCSSLHGTRLVLILTNE